MPDPSFGFGTDRDLPLAERLTNIVISLDQAEQRGELGLAAQRATASAELALEATLKRIAEREVAPEKVPA
jgi:hypothetical protein